MCIYSFQAKGVCNVLVGRRIDERIMGAKAFVVYKIEHLEKLYVYVRTHRIVHICISCVRVWMHVAASMFCIMIKLAIKH